LSARETDVLVIGCGIAGASVALRLSQDRARQVTIVTRAADPEESNTRYAQGGIVTLGEDDSPDLIVQDILAAGYALVSGKQTTAITADALNVMNLTQDESYGDINWGAAYTGGEDDEGEYLPGPVSALGSVITLLPRVQGRKFVPGFTETNLMDGKFGGGTIADVLDFMEWFYLTTHGEGDAVCDFGLYNPELERWTPAYAVAASAIPAYQRRRRIGVGS
jgi:hypothetical protein